MHHARLRLQGPSLLAWQQPVDSEKAALSSSGSSHCLGRPSADTSVIHVKCPGSHGVGVGHMIKNVNNCQRAILYSNGLR